MARRVARLALLVVVSACGNGNDDHPPAYQPPPRDDLWGCAALRQAEPELRSDVLYVGENPAACAVDGLACTLVGVVGVGSSCETTEVPVAYCVAGQWQHTCFELPLPQGQAGQAG